MKIYPRLEEVIAGNDYSLQLIYSNGEKRLYNFKPNLDHSYYAELKDVELFCNVKAVNGELEWKTGQDFCPHTLYEQSVLEYG